MDKMNIIYRIKPIDLEKNTENGNQYSEYLSEDDLTQYDLLFSDIEINGKPFVNRSVDFLALHKALLKEKSSPYIFTCSCGIPGCAGVWSGIDVSNEKDKIIWRFNKERYDLLIKEEVSKELVVDGKDYVLVFDKEQYTIEIEQFAKKMKKERESQSKAMVLEVYGDMPTVDDDVKNYENWLNDDDYFYEDEE